MPEKPISLCPSCGVLWNTAAHCGHCNAHRDKGPLLVPPRSDGAYWVCIECTYRCVSCGFNVPLNHLLDAGEDGVVCLRCGLEQAFDHKALDEALAEAHALGDFYFQGVPPGVEDETARVGGEHSGVAVKLGGTNHLAIQARPGHPLCSSCKAPLALEVASDGTSSYACACGERASYALHSLGNKARGLRAVLADEHRTDRPLAAIAPSSSAAVAITCPRCSAPLDAKEESRYLTCAYCGTASRIPDRTWSQLRRGEPKAEPLWLLFSGPSERREEEARARSERERRQAEERAEVAARDERDRKGRIERAVKLASTSMEDAGAGVLVGGLLGGGFATSGMLSANDASTLAYVCGLAGLVLAVALGVVGVWKIQDRVENGARERAEAAEREGRGTENLDEEGLRATKRSRKVKIVLALCAAILVLVFVLDVVWAHSHAVRSHR